MDLGDRRNIESTVYPPAEDSRLLARATASLLEGDERVLEVGVGSGWVAEQLAALGVTVVGSDVNPHACRAAADRGIEVVQGDLLSPFQAATFDVVSCNPPYLPANDHAAREDWMERALTGGQQGRAVIVPFIEDVGRVLRHGGVACLVASSLSGLPEIEEHAKANGLSVDTIEAETHPFERLVALALRPS